jgi:DnaA family protein
MAAGRSAVYAAEPGALAADPGVLARSALVAVDRVEAAGADAQARLFTLYNELRTAGGALLVAAGAAPAILPLRDDLRSRLGWGLVFEVLPLADDEKPAALVAWARLRGLTLADEVVAYLLAHGRRDMASLLATLTALDRHSLATRRAITVPLVREWLQRDIGFTARPD